MKYSPRLSPWMFALADTSQFDLCFTFWVCILLLFHFSKKHNFFSSFSKKLSVCAHLSALILMMLCSFRISPELLFIHWVIHLQIILVNTYAKIYQAFEEQMIHIDNQGTFESQEIVIKWNSTCNTVSREGVLKMQGRQMHEVHFWDELRIVVLLYLPNSPAIFKHRHNSQTVSCSKHRESQAAILVSSLEHLLKGYILLMKKRPIFTTKRSVIFRALCSPFFSTVASYYIIF